MTSQHSVLQEELVRAFKLGDEAQARALVLRLGTRPSQIRAVLEEMLKHPESLFRQAAAFGLGELGGAASVRRLEEQLAVEEARGDHDGEAVVEDITRALGRIKGSSARAGLVRRLQRMPASNPERGDVNELASALWRKRHPDLIPVVRSSLDKFSLRAPHALHGLLTLLEKSPEELDAWARDPAVSWDEKTTVLAIFEEDLPDSLVPVLRAFIAAGQDASEQIQGHRSEAESYCERVFSVLLQNPERLVVAVPEEVRSELRALARKVILATSPDPSLGAAVTLKWLGHSEDAEFLDAHCPTYSTFAKVYRDAAHALRERRPH